MPSSPSGSAVGRAWLSIPIATTGDWAHYQYTMDVISVDPNLNSLNNHECQTAKRWGKESECGVVVSAVCGKDVVWAPILPTSTSSNQRAILTRLGFLVMISCPGNVIETILVV